MKSKIQTLVILGFTVFSSCVKDQPLRPANNVEKPKPGQGFFICNEGNFLSGNASLSYFNYQTKQISEDIFKAATGQNLGDVCQSLTVIGNQAFIVVNNSSKIEILNLETFKSAGSISGLKSPRYLLPISADKAYVSDLRSNGVSVINLQNNSISKFISCKGWTERMLLHKNTAWLSNVYNKHVYVVDTQADAMIDSVVVNYGASSLVKDKNDNIWVLCAGNNKEKDTAALYQINGDSRHIIKKFRFKVDESPGNLCINAAKDTLYFLNKGLFKMTISAVDLPPTPFIPSAGRLFYSLVIDPNTGYILVSDAIDYVQKGAVYIYHAQSAALVHQFKAGIIPGNFAFY